MPANRCPVCEINYPTEFGHCVVCDREIETVAYYAPDTEWERKAKDKLQEVEGFLFIFVDLDERVGIYPHRHDSQVPVHIDEGGRLWISHEDLLDCGYSYMEPDKIVFVNGKFYELQSFRRTNRQWLVEEVDPEAELADLPVLSEEPERIWRDGS